MLQLNPYVHTLLRKVGCDLTVSELCMMDDLLCIGSVLKPKTGQHVLDKMVGWRTRIQRTHKSHYTIVEGVSERISGTELTAELTADAADEM